MHHVTTCSNVYQHHAARLTKFAPSDLGPVSGETAYDSISVDFLMRCSGVLTSNLNCCILMAD